jgi:hypothetical protein
MGRPHAADLCSQHHESTTHIDIYILRDRRNYHHHCGEVMVIICCLSRGVCGVIIAVGRSEIPVELLSELDQTIIDDSTSTHREAGYGREAATKLGPP